MSHKKKRSSLPVDGGTQDYYNQALNNNKSYQENTSVQIPFYQNLDDQEQQSVNSITKHTKTDEQIMKGKTQQPDNQSLEIYHNDYASNFKSKSKVSLGYDSNRSNILDRHQQSQASCASNRSTVSQRRGRSHRQRSRQSSNKQLPSVGQMPNKTIDSQASPMMIQKQLINNSNQKMFELISAQKSCQFLTSIEKPQLQISQSKFGVNMSETSLETYKPGNQKEYNYLDFIKGVQNLVSPNPLAEFNHIVTEYKDIKPKLGDKSKSDNKVSTTKKKPPVSHRVDGVSKGRIGSSTNQKNDSKVSKDDTSGTISKFILPQEVAGEISSASEPQNPVDYNNSLNQPQIYKQESHVQRIISCNPYQSQSSQNTGSNVQQSYVHDYVEKSNNNNYTSFENQKLKINDNAFSPQQNSPRFNEIMKIMSDEKSQNRRSSAFSQSSGSKNKSSSKSKMTGKKSKAKSKLILQTLEIQSDENITNPSNDSDHYKTMDIMSPVNKKTKKKSKKSIHSTVKKNQSQILSPYSQQSQTSKLSKSKRKRKNKISRNLDDSDVKQIENEVPNAFMKDLDLMNSICKDQYENLELHQQKSSAKKTKKQSGKKPLRPPNQLTSPFAQSCTNIRKDVHIEAQKQSRLLENIIMSPLNRGTGQGSQYFGLFSDRKLHGKIPTEEILLKKSSQKKKNAFNFQQNLDSIPGTARVSNVDFTMCLEDDLAQLRSPTDSAIKKSNHLKKSSNKQTPIKRSNIPTVLACFSPKSLPQQAKKIEPLKPEFITTFTTAESCLQLKKSNTTMSIKKNQNQGHQKNSKSSSVALSDMEEQRKHSKSQLQNINNEKQQKSKMIKPQILDDMEDSSFFKNEEHAEEVDNAINKALSASQRLGGTGRFHSRKNSTIAEYIQCRTSKNTSQTGLAQTSQSGPSKTLPSKTAKENTQPQDPQTLIGTNKALTKKQMLPPKSSLISTSASGLNTFGTHNTTQARNSASNLFSTKSVQDSPKKAAKKKAQANQFFQRQKQAQSCVDLEQYKGQSKSALGNTLDDIPKGVDIQGNLGLKSTLNLVSGYGNLTSGSSVQPKATKTPSQAGKSQLAKKLIDSHEEIAVKTQESSQHRSKNSSDDKSQSQHIKKEKPMIMGPGLENILEQEDDLQEVADHKISIAKDESQSRNDQDALGALNQCSSAVYNHMISNDTEMITLRGELFDPEDPLEANQNIQQNQESYYQQANLFKTNNEYYAQNARLACDQDPIQNRRQKQKSQDMFQSEITANQNIKQVETPERKSDIHYKTGQKLSASQQLLADRRSRDRQKTQTRNVAGSFYQVRKMKSEQNGFLLNQITQPVGTTTLRQKKQVPPKNLQNSSSKQNSCADIIKPQILQNAIGGTSRASERPVLHKKQSMPVRDSSQSNYQAQKKPLNLKGQNDFNLQGRNKKQSIYQQNNQTMQSLKTNLQTASTTEIGTGDKTAPRKNGDVQIPIVTEACQNVQPVLSKNGGSTKSNISSAYHGQPNKFTRVNDSRITNLAKTSMNNYTTQTSLRRNTNISSVRNQNGIGQQKTPITQKIGGYGAGSKAAAPSKQQPDMILLQSEKEKYGDRCPNGYKKLSLLGKGGIALVWLAEVKDHKKCGLSESMVGQKVALKQFPKVRGKQAIDGSAKIEIETGNTLFPLTVKDGCTGDKDSDFERTYAIDPELHPGMKSIARLIDQVDERADFWLVYEVGSHCLGKHLCEVKGEFYKGERIYNCSHQKFYMALARNTKILGTLIKKISEIFDVLSRFGIVHSDIKPDNILVELNSNESDIESVKLIDFGSAFQFHNVTQITATTPEYLAPEILNYLEDRNKNSKSNLSSALSLRQNCQPWSFDVWSLGVILLEIATGFPVWMSLKCRVSTVDGKSVLGSGIFGVQGREGKKIIVKQQQIVKNLKTTLKKYECYNLDQDPYFMDLLQKMLDFNPTRRISPLDIVNHPFCQN